MTVITAANPGHAQDAEVPLLILEAPAVEVESEDDLDLANVVMATAKMITTVQAAPAIITIVTADEIKDRHMRNLQQVLDLVPGWLRVEGLHGQFPFTLARGTPQAVLLLRDGVLLFDSMFNVSMTQRAVPLENIKRIEAVTGPGGVLWGANSFLGVVNVITKDAEDVDGVEASAGFGSGPGDLGVYRGYVMVGAPELGSSKVKLFAHASFESFEGPQFEMPYFMFHSPAPAPNSLLIYGATTKTDAARSLMLNFDGKLSVGQFNFYWSVPYIQRYAPLTFAGGFARENLPEDPYCPEDESIPPAKTTPDGQPVVCTDRRRASRKNAIPWADRYAIAEYRTRFAGGRGGIATKGYFTQFARDWLPLVVLPPIEGLLEGGLAFNVHGTNYRAGGTVDSDYELTPAVRLMYGVEAFHEWMPPDTQRSRQGEGIETYFDGPYEFSHLPIPCPHAAKWDPQTNSFASGSGEYLPGCPLTFVFRSSRTVFGTFAAAQWRPVPRLLLDGGVRAQMAPAALGVRSYDPQVLGSAAVIYEFVPNWHLKLNFTQGFRPPLLNGTDSNGEAVTFKGQRDLVPERSAAVQAEVNARLLRLERHVRELDVRLDYSYTILENYISVDRNQYENFGSRGISSAELLAKLYLKGFHRFELGYTWLRIAMADKGLFRATPEHWFNMSAVLSLLDQKLELSSTLRIVGAFEDPNRRVDVSRLETDPLGSPSGTSQTLYVQPFELTLDRIPPSAELQIGARYYAMGKRLVIAAIAENALDSQRYQPDPAHSWSPRLEILPNPYERFRFFASATFRY